MEEERTGAVVGWSGSVDNKWQVGSTIPFKHNVVLQTVVGRLQHTYTAGESRLSSEPRCFGGQAYYYCAEEDKYLSLPQGGAFRERERESRMNG